MRFKEVRRLVEDMEYISAFINEHPLITKGDDERVDFLAKTMNVQLKLIQETVVKFELDVRKKNNLDSSVNVDNYDTGFPPDFADFIEDSIVKNKMFLVMIEKLKERGDWKQKNQTI